MTTPIWWEAFTGAPGNWPVKVHAGCVRSGTARWNGGSVAKKDIGGNR